MTMVENEPRRLRHARERRVRIEQAALALFAERGFAATSVDEIAARADVAKGTFFSYFPSKPEVLAGYYRALDARFFAALEKLDPARPEAALTGYYRAAERILRAEGSLARVLFEAIAVDPHLGELDRASGESAEQRVARFLARAQELGVLREELDPALAARVLTDLWAATVREWIEADQDFSLARRLAAKAHLLFVGMVAPPATPGRRQSAMRR